MIVKIITTDPTLLKWRSLPRKLKEIKQTLQTIKNVRAVTINIEYMAVTPEVKDGRITHEWMESLTLNNTDSDEFFCLLHMSDAQRKRWGIKPTLRGVAFNDPNFKSEAYFWADENTKRGRFNQFIETFLHELSHLLYHRSGRPDKTHEYHAKHGTIKGLFKEHDILGYYGGIINKIYAWYANIYGPKFLLPSVIRRAQMIVDEMKFLGYDVHVYEGYRSMQRQQELYDKGRKTPGPIVTNAKPGESLHNYGVAVDIVFGKPGSPNWSEKNPWATLGRVGKTYGFQWGGDWTTFQDKPHFELLLDYKLKDFQDKKVDYNKYL